jgi:phosphoribosyl-ATP pyrophosphohydrolase/phosphoribosyl-AMP cyclohydrolase/histidinol dehydrogenase
LWIKGETSGATQQLLGIRMDCDRDCLRFKVTQDPPGFCHLNTHTCFGEERTIESVVQRLIERINDSDEGSFTRKLANNAKMLEAKLLEEAQELSEASRLNDKHEIAWEAADVLYFSLVAMLKNGVTLDRVFQELARRMNRVVRRKNKLEATQPGNEGDG